MPVIARRAAASRASARRAFARLAAQDALYALAGPDPAGQRQFLARRAQLDHAELARFPVGLAAASSAPVRSAAVRVGRFRGIRLLPITRCATQCLPRLRLPRFPLSRIHSYSS